jgi:hypothetical protein
MPDFLFLIILIAATVAGLAATGHRRLPGHRHDVA